MLILSKKKFLSRKILDKIKQINQFLNKKKERKLTMINVLSGYYVFIGTSPCFFKRSSAMTNRKLNKMARQSLTFTNILSETAMVTEIFMAVG